MEFLGHAQSHSHAKIPRRQVAGTKSNNKLASLRDCQLKTKKGDGWTGGQTNRQTDRQKVNKDKRMPKTNVQKDKRTNRRTSKWVN